MTEVAAQLKDSQLKDWRFSIDGEGIAWAIFDREGESANSLGRRPIEELNAIIERVEPRKSVLSRATRGRRCVALQSLLEPAIELRRRNASVPRRMRLDNRRHQLV